MIFFCFNSSLRPGCRNSYRKSSLAFSFSFKSWFFFFFWQHLFLFFPFGFPGCRNSYHGLTWSLSGATYSSPEPCWLLTYFSRPFYSKGLVPDNYFWCKLALNRQKNITVSNQFASERTPPALIQRQNLHLQLKWLMTVVLFNYAVPKCFNDWSPVYNPKVDEPILAGIRN
jgi:hypothetical protein